MLSAEALAHDPTLVDPGAPRQSMPPTAAHDALDGQRRCRVCGGLFPDDFAVCPRDASPLGVDSREADPLIGTVLAGTYQLTRVLGSGAMGKLYDAEHVRLGSRFAIKVIHEVYASEAAAIARFEREARAAARIRSDHVLDVVDILRVADGRPCFVAERLEGEDLQVRLDRVGAMTAPEAIAITRQICRGLAAAHAHGVIHRDLKPSNLFLAADADARVTVKILDFGVAKLVGEEELTRSGAVVGTPAYMAPEQARGSADVDERVDIYAVGAVLYRMLTGRAPHLGADPTATLAKLLHEDPPRPRSLCPSIPAALELVVQRALSRNPRDRHATVSALDFDLAAFEEPSAILIAGAPGALEGAQAASAGTKAKEAAPDTLVLPRGSVQAAETAHRRARHARPFAAGMASLFVLVSALGASIIVRGFMSTVSPGRGGHAAGTAFTYVVVLGAGLAAFAHVRESLRGSWHDAAAVLRIASKLFEAIGGGLVVYGLWKLVPGGMDALFGDGSVGAASADAISVVVAFAVALAVHQRAAITYALAPLKPAKR